MPQEYAARGSADVGLIAGLAVPGEPTHRGSATRSTPSPSTPSRSGRDARRHPNIPLWNRCRQQCLSRAELADRINASPNGVTERLVCDEDRIRRRKSGEVRWPSPIYRHSEGRDWPRSVPSRIHATRASRRAADSH